MGRSGTVEIITLVRLLQILFMNKTDLFREKVLHSGRHVRSYIRTYTGTLQVCKGSERFSLHVVCPGSSERPSVGAS